MFKDINNPVIKGIFINSLARRLAVSVFRNYVIFALMLTAFQIVVEYNAARQRVFNDLQSIVNSFKGSLTKALWSMDRELIYSEASGMISAPSVSGLKLIDEDDKILVQMGDEFADHKSNFSSHISVELIKSDTAKGLHRLGYLELYANPSISINQLKASSLAIIIINQSISKRTIRRRI